jgi:hypothetical protein
VLFAAWAFEKVQVIAASYCGAEVQTGTSTSCTGTGGTGRTVRFSLGTACNRCLLADFGGGGGGGAGFSTSTSGGGGGGGTGCFLVCARAAYVANRNTVLKRNFRFINKHFS